MSTRRAEVVVFNYTLGFISICRETCFYKCWQLGCLWVGIFYRSCLERKRNLGLKKIQCSSYKGKQWKNIWLHAWCWPSRDGEVSYTWVRSCSAPFFLINKQASRGTDFLNNTCQKSNSKMFPETSEEMWERPSKGFRDREITERQVRGRRWLCRGERPVLQVSRILEGGAAGMNCEMSRFFCFV